jgi:DNA polymerase-3 subunit alpha
MVDDWVARKQGKTEVKYELPQLEPILSDTYGVIAYQEQVMRIAQALAGFTLGQPTCCARPWARKTQGHGQAARRLHGRRAAKGSTRRRPPRSSS